MAGTTNITSVKMVASNTDPAPSGVTCLPASRSDGKYTWACVGQKTVGSTATITFSVYATASGPKTVTVNGANNYVQATASAGATNNYVQCTCTFSGTSSPDNWTVHLMATSGSNYVKFTRGTGGGSARAGKTAGKKTTPKAARKKASRAGKKAAPKRAGKVAKKAAVRSKAKTVNKVARKAARPAKKAGRK